MVILVAAVSLLIWNGTAFFSYVGRHGDEFGPEVQMAATALTLNVVLILFGWRRYVELQHEAEWRAEGERRAIVLATTDHVTGLNNRKGFADKTEDLLAAARDAGDSLVMLSLQIHRFKIVSDQHGYDTGDKFLKCIGTALVEELGPDAVIARLSGDEFAAAVTMTPGDVARAEQLAERALRAVTR